MRMAMPKPFSITAKNQLQLVALPMRGNQWLVLLLFPTFRVLQNPSREFWIAIMLKLLKNLFRFWGILLPNLRILSGKNKEQMLFILFHAMTVITSTLDTQDVSLVHVWKSSFLLKKRKFSFIRACMPN